MKTRSAKNKGKRLQNDVRDLILETFKELEPDDSSLAAAELDKKWAEIRRRRNRLLTESDWVVVKAKETHANASIPSDWVDYRTELRDITKQSDPDDITWPTKPS